MRGDIEEVVDIAQEGGADHLYLLEREEEVEFLMLGSISEEAVDRLREVDGQNIYLNPWRAKWSYTDSGEVEVLGPVLQEDFERVKEQGEKLV